MIKVCQTRTGSDGNCWPACLASMLECSIEEVDHCSHNLDVTNRSAFKATDEFLAKRGLFYVEIARNEVGNYLCSELPEGALLICGVKTKRGLPHVVIARVEHTPTDSVSTEQIHDAILRMSDPDTPLPLGMQLIVVHDPMPGGSEIIDVNHLMLLCRLDREPIIEFTLRPGTEVVRGGR